MKRFWKQKTAVQYTATVKAEPGKTTLVILHHEGLVTRLVLDNLSMDSRTGVTATFTDHSRWVTGGRR